MQHQGQFDPQNNVRTGQGQLSGYGVRPTSSPVPPGGQQPPARQPQRRPAGTPPPNNAQAPFRRGRNPKAQRPGEEVGNRWVSAMLMVLATIAGCVFLAFFILTTALDWAGLNQPDMVVEVSIPDGATTREVSAILKENGIIDSPWVFRTYASFAKKVEEGDFQPGNYTFNMNLSFDELIRNLRIGANAKETIRLTFREGRTTAEIAQLLEQYEVCDAEEFLAYLDSQAFTYDFHEAIPDNEHRFRKLEGYIFPDTYDFYLGESVQEVARKFLDNLNEKITDEMYDRMQELGLSLDDTLILASVIQKEAGKEEDMRKVSSVFHNRLALPSVYPRLQSDVTIFYVENEIKPYMEEPNQEMYDAYNTYEREGLPVGAICNPGLMAINAALNPAITDYYFFVTDKNEEFYYAETSAEHYQNVAAALEVGGDAHGIDTQ